MKLYPCTNCGKLLKIEKDVDGRFIFCPDCNRFSSVANEHKIKDYIHMVIK